MIRLMDGLPSNVVGLVAVGEVSSHDYESTVTPAIEKAVEAGDGLRVVYFLGDEFEGFAAEAAIDDMKMGMHNWSAFEKIALVTDLEAYRIMTKAFGFLMHGEVKVFSTDELDAAMFWASSSPEGA